MQKLVAALIFLAAIICISIPHTRLNPDIIPNIVSVSERTPQKPTKVYTVISVDPDFSSYERSIIEEAANDWSYYTNDIATFKFVDGDPLNVAIKTEPGQIGQPLIIRPLNSSDLRTLTFDIAINGTTMGMYDPSTFIPTIWIIIDRIQDEEEMLGVVLHELGHAEGLEHSSIQNSLMFPYVSTSCITKYDLRQFCSIYGCDYENMNFCFSDNDGPSCLPEEFNGFDLR